MKELTEREAEIWGLIAEGRRNKDIALELKLSYRTVRWYATSLFKKLGVRNRTEAAVKFFIERMVR